MMRAAVLTATNTLVIEERPMPVRGEDEVILRVRAAGICGSDLPRVFAGKVYHFPLVLGHEFAGEVVDAADPALIGTRAAIFPLLPCRKCAMCAEEEYPLCADYDYYGSRRDGAMEEYLAVKIWNLIPVPEGLSLEEAAMCEPAAVARHAIMRAGISGGERVLVFGAGPIGLMLGQWAMSMGAASVAFADIDERKLVFAETMGFGRQTEGAKYDVVIEGAGAPSALQGAIAAAEPFGRLVLMGNASRDMDIPQAVYQQILRKQLTLTGTWNSSYNSRVNDWKAALEAMASGALSAKPLITHTYPLEEVRAAFDMMGGREAFYNKVMIVM
ncbi:MAG: galactitol-1-phosphate 5-dehydrogenase [Clostridia bacterium]|nr:galactitol-1-phosphate 5-dehydrogenase [Clostridia bacterium]